MDCLFANMMSTCKCNTAYRLLAERVTVKWQMPSFVVIMHTVSHCLPCLRLIYNYSADCTCPTRACTVNVLDVVSQMRTDCLLHAAAAFECSKLHAQVSVACCKAGSKEWVISSSLSALQCLPAEKQHY